MRIALVTGTVGIGKSATGYAVAERAASQGRSAAFLDVDELSRLWPASVGDPFNNDLILRNLASLVGNYAAAGAKLLVLAWVVQSTDGLRRLEEAVGTSVVAVRLCAPASTVEARLRQRLRSMHTQDQPTSTAWPGTLIALPSCSRFRIAGCTCRSLTRQARSATQPTRFSHCSSNRRSNRVPAQTWWALVGAAPRA